MTPLPQHVCVRLLADVASALRPALAEFTDEMTLRSIDTSIHLSITAAAGEFPRPDLREDAKTATILAGKAELHSQGLFVRDDDRQSPLGSLTSDQLKYVRDVADIAARSLRAATGDESGANTECQEGLSWAYDMAERLGDEALQHRIQSLVDSAVP